LFRPSSRRLLLLTQIGLDQFGVFAFSSPSRGLTLPPLATTQRWCFPSPRCREAFFFSMYSFFFQTSFSPRSVVVIRSATRCALEGPETFFSLLLQWPFSVFLFAFSRRSFRPCTLRVLARASFPTVTYCPELFSPFTCFVSITRMLSGLSPLPGPPGPSVY